MQAASSARFPLRVAAIDVGSNGMRCMAVEFHQSGGHEVLLQERAAVRLGHSVFSKGTIDMASMEAALDALGAFRKQLDGLHIEHVRAVATSAVREAGNRDQLLKRARKQAGVNVEVISGSEEARLVHLAISKRIPFNGGSWILMDLGGGSVEVSVADKQGIQWTDSHPMGSVRLLEEFEAMKGETKKMQKLIMESVDAMQIPAAPKGKALQGVIATGGNIEDLARLAGARDPETKVSELAVKDLRKLLEKLADMDERDRIKEYGLRPDRADVILPAGLVYEHVANVAGVERILVPHVGVKEGILQDLVDSLVVDADPRARRERLVHEGSRTLGRRFRFDEAHGMHVARLALAIFDQTQAEHGLGDADRAILQASAILHDIGRFVDDRKHHKHSYYLISQSDVPGLSEHETELAAQVGRYHRRKEPNLKHEPFARLSPADRDRVLRLSAILRVADALDSEHRQAVRTVTIQRKGNKTDLHVHGEGDLALEEWAVKNKGGLYARVFGTTVELHAEGDA